MKQEIDDEINEAFHLFDTNRKNYLNKKELKAAMSAFGIKKDPIEILNYFGEEDKETYSLEDFHSIMRDNIADRYSKAEIDKIYDVFNIDGNGITVDNIKSIAKEIDEYITHDEIQEIIMEADKDCDNKLDRKEFYNIMKRKDDFYDFDDDEEEDDMNLRMTDEQYAGM